MDEELKIIKSIEGQMAKLPPNARSRVVAYLTSKWKELSVTTTNTLQKRKESST